MGEEPCEMHSGDDKSLLDKNKKRKVKTPAQVLALEKFYNEHKYPSEPLKIQLGNSIGLTEKQVSGWFCHRRLKDKKSTIEEKHLTLRKQDRSSGVIQDSCGSTKQGDDRNLDTREVESERLTPKDFSTADIVNEHRSNRAGNCIRTDHLSSGSSSSMSNHQTGVLDLPFYAETTSRYPVPKFHAGEKTRSGPSGYLKVKGRVENSAITAVKRQLGKHYREEGPPLGVDFDPLPPGVFESAPICDLKPNTALDNPNINMRSFKQMPTFGISESHSLQKFKKQASLPDSGVYYPRSNSSLEFPGGPSRDITGGENRDGYGTRVRPRVEVTRADSSFLRNPNLQPYGRKVRDEHPESWFHKYNKDVVPKVSLVQNEYSNLAVKDDVYYSSGVSRQIIKAPKRTKEEFPQQKYLNMRLVTDNEPLKHRVVRSSAEMPSGFRDKESVETSSSVD